MFNLKILKKPDKSSIPIDQKSCLLEGISKEKLESNTNNNFLQENGIWIELLQFRTFERNYEKLKLISIYGVAKICINGNIVQYKYYATCVSGKLNNVAIRSMNNEELFPKLKYNTNERKFLFNNISEPALKTGNTKEIILSALLVWAKLQFSQN